MKIVVKQTDVLKGTTKIFKGIKKVEEFIVYLIDDNGRPLLCEVKYGIAAKNDFVGALLLEYFLPEDWENNKESFDVSSVLEEMSYDEYLEQ
jgi:hypothetical protein